MLNGISRVFASFSRKPTLRSKQRISAAVAEVLERRRLLSATASVVSNVLTVSGDTATDTIVVQKDGGGTNAQVVVNSSVIFTTALSGLTAISLSNSGGNDTLTVDSAITLPATITGGSGSENITGGGGADSLIGNGGADSIVGGAGNDTLEGDAGDDTLVGGAGNDLYTFAGSGSPGSDTL